MNVYEVLGTVVDPHPVLHRRKDYDSSFQDAVARACLLQGDCFSLSTPFLPCWPLKETLVLKSHLWKNTGMTFSTSHVLVTKKGRETASSRQGSDSLSLVKHS